MKKTEVTTTIAEQNVNDAVREAIDPVKYDEYRRQWKEATELNLVTEFPLQIDFELNYSCNFTAWHQECCTKTRFKIFESFRIPLKS